MDESPERKIGYKNPPAEHRFKKGQPSPNPKGRPRKSAAYQQAVIDELNRKVSVTVGGRRRKISITQLALQQLGNKAAAGNLHAIREINKLAERVAPLKPLPEGTDEDLQKRQELAAKLVEMLERASTRTKPERPRGWPPRGADDGRGDPDEDGEG